MRMFIFVYVLNMLQMGRLHGQCYPPLEKRKMVIVKEQSRYLSAFQFEKHDIFCHALKNKNKILAKSTLLFIFALVEQTQNNILIF
jgi:hypothetical protein